ncbi:hypothetical protein, partial [Streptomyces sp. NPDC093594]|uniref:hypothetical protein n=1 Tax=Streptomyces sp. NPDC093594 TaxID=3155305 RepID=UPI00344E437D
MPKKGNNSLKQKARRLAQYEGIPYSEALAILAAPATEAPARSNDSTYASETLQRIIAESIRPALDLQRIVAESIQPKIDLQRSIAESIRPALDLQRIVAESIQPKIDLQRSIAE